MIVALEEVGSEARPRFARRQSQSDCLLLRNNVTIVKLDRDDRGQPKAHQISRQSGQCFVVPLPDGVVSEVQRARPDEGSISADDVPSLS